MPKVNFMNKRRLFRKNKQVTNPSHCKTFGSFSVSSKVVGIFRAIFIAKIKLWGPLLFAVIFLPCLIEFLDLPKREMATEDYSGGMMVNGRRPQNLEGIGRVIIVGDGIQTSKSFSEGQFESGRGNGEVLALGHIQGDKVSNPSTKDNSTDATPNCSSETGHNEPFTFVGFLLWLLCTTTTAILLNLLFVLFLPF